MLDNGHVLVPTSPELKALLPLKAHPEMIGEISSAPRVAIVHYWTTIGAGGDKVVEAISELYPHADIFMLLHEEEVSRRLFPGKTVKSSFLQKFPGIVKYYTKLLPLMPMALESLDLRGYDLIISSESGPAKGIIPPVDSLHICYCHTPMRYLWDQFADYRQSSSLLTRISMTVFGPRLRSWDVTTAARVDSFIANSNHVANRIRRYYGRSSAVIHPPVETDAFALSSERGGYFLAAGRHVAYKRLDLAIAAANQMGFNLIVSGSGAETDRLKKIAGPTVKFVGQVDFATLCRLYSECEALIMPGEEDFGIVPVEVMASGRPVIAYGRGGVLDSVIPGKTGLLFPEQSVSSLASAIEAFRQQEFDPEEVRAHALTFSKSVFKEQFSNFITAAQEKKK